MNGWVKLYRSYIDSQVFQNEGLWKVWSWCLMKVNFKEQWISMRTGKGFTELKLLPGQFVYGRESAARELHMPPTTIRDRIKKLEKMKFLAIQSAKHYSVVTLANWEEHQVHNENSATQSAYEPPPNRHPTATEKNDKKEKNEKKRKGVTTTAPTIFEIDEKIKRWAASNGCKSDLENEAEKFIEYHRAKGSKFACWSSAFRSWIRKDMEWHPERHSVFDKKDCPEFVCGECQFFLSRCKGLKKEETSRGCGLHVKVKSE